MQPSVAARRERERAREERGRSTASVERDGAESAVEGERGREMSEANLSSYIYITDMFGPSVGPRPFFLRWKV